MAAASSSALAEEQARIEIGIIGMGDMGRLYAQRFADAGWQQ
jgi:prephenate dehydrogenase